VPRVSSDIRISIWPLGRFLMDSSWERVSRFSLSGGTSGFFVLPKPEESSLLLDAAPRHDLFGRRLDEVFGGFFVPRAERYGRVGAEVTSSLKPRPTASVAGGSAWRTGNAVFVPRAVCGICAKLR